jgi:hypothetical protein
MSTLQVENLIGPTSGSNANKVIIPSGQTLDASAATLVPSAGQVVQCVQYYDPSASSEQTTSTSLVSSIVHKTITPKYSDSKIVIQLSLSMVDAQQTNIRGRMRVNDVDMPSAEQFMLGFQDGNAQARYTPWTFNGNYQCTSTAPLTFRVYYMSGSSSVSVKITHNQSAASLILWEIAQ